MRVTINIAALGRTRWYEYLVRFVFGSILAALTGIIAKRWGPEIGGLFLAFPAIFPATATLLEKHERQKKERSGKPGTLRGRAIAGVDAAGAAMGSIGLAAFAVIVWRWVPHHPVGLVLGTATFAWFMTAGLLWRTRKTGWTRLGTKLFTTAKRVEGIGIPRESSQSKGSHE
jgi:uncharacterized membrane protein YfcA